MPSVHHRVAVDAGHPCKTTCRPVAWRLLVAVLLALPLLQPLLARASWDVDRTVRGRMVLDRMFKGSGIAGTPDGRNLERFETWVATSTQVIEMEVNDHGSFFGIVSSGHPALDKTVFRCPEPDARHPNGRLRASILQFDKLKGTWTLETGRMIHRCATSTLRTPQYGPPSWSSRPPFEQRPYAHELEFEIWQGFYPLTEFHWMTGPHTEGATELVLSRDFTFHWARGLSAKAPVPGRLDLVLRKQP